MANRGRPTKEEVANRSPLGLKRIQGSASEIVSAIEMAIDPHPKGKFTDKDDVYQLCLGYFNYIVDVNDNRVDDSSKVVPDMYSLASWLGTTPRTIDHYIKNNVNGMADVFSWAKNVVASCISQLALNGKLHPVVFTATMNNMHDWTTNKTQTEITHIKAEQPTIEQLLKEAEQLPIEGEFKEIETD